MPLNGPPPWRPGQANLVELRQQTIYQLMALFADERRLISAHLANVHSSQPNEISLWG
jgi:hypothetical protein